MYPSTILLALTKTKAQHGSRYHPVPSPRHPPFSVFTKSHQLSFHGNSMKANIALMPSSKMNNKNLSFPTYNVWAGRPKSMSNLAPKLKLLNRI